MIRARKDSLVIQCGPLTGNGMNRYYDHLIGRFSKPPFERLYLSWGERLDDIMPDSVGRYCDDVVRNSGSEFIHAPSPAGHGGRYLIQGIETVLVTNIPFFGDSNPEAWQCGLRVTRDGEHGNWLADRLLSLSGDIFPLPEVRREMLSRRTGLREPNPGLPDFPTSPLSRNRDADSTWEGDDGSNQGCLEISFNRFQAWLHQWIAWGTVWQSQWDRSDPFEVLTNNDLAERIVETLQQEEGMILLGTELPQGSSAPWMAILEALDLRLQRGRRVFLVLSRDMDSSHDEVLRNRIGMHKEVYGPLQVIVRPFHGSVLISSRGSLVSGTPMLSSLVEKRRVGQETMAARMGVWIGNVDLRRDMIQSLRRWDQRIPEELVEESIPGEVHPASEDTPSHLEALGQFLDEIEHDHDGEARARTLRAWAANAARTPDAIPELLRVWQNTLKEDAPLFEQCVAALLGQSGWHRAASDVANEWLAWLAQRYWQSERFVHYTVLSGALTVSTTQDDDIFPPLPLVRFVAFGQVDDTQLITRHPSMAKGFAAELTRRLLVGNLATTTDLEEVIDLFLDQNGQEIGPLGEILRMVNTFTCHHGFRVETDEVAVFIRCWEVSQDSKLEEMDNIFRVQIGGLHLRTIDFDSGREAWAFLFDKAKGPVGVLREMVNLSPNERLEQLDSWLSERYGDLYRGHRTGQDDVVDGGDELGYEAWVTQDPGRDGESPHKEKVSQKIGISLLEVANRQLGELGMKPVRKPRFNTIANQLADFIHLIHQLVMRYRKRRFRPKDITQWEETRQLADQLQLYSREIRAWAEAAGDPPEGNERVLMRRMAREILAGRLLDLGGIPKHKEVGG